MLRALGEIAQHLHNAGASGGGAQPTAVPGFWGRLRAALASRPMRYVAGTLIIAGGLGEALQAYQGVAGAGRIYQWGVVLVGLLIIGRAGHQLHEGLELLGRADAPGWLKPIEHFFERPSVQLVLSLALCGLAAIELWSPGAIGPGGGEAAGDASPPLGAHGLAVLGSLSLSRAAMDLFNGARHAWRLRDTGVDLGHPLEAE